MAGMWRLEPDEACLAVMHAMEQLLQLPLLLRLASRRADEMELVETDAALMLIQVPLLLAVDCQMNTPIQLYCRWGSSCSDLHYSGHRPIPGAL